MRKTCLWALILFWMIGLGACSNPFVKPATFEESYAALISGGKSESFISALENMVASEQSAKIVASYKSSLTNGTVAMDYQGKQAKWSGSLDSKLDASLSFSGDINTPILEANPENIKTQGKMDFRMIGEKIYMRLDDMKASSPDTKLSDQIGAWVGIVTWALGGKWIVVDLSKYRSIMGTGMTDSLSIQEIYGLEKTITDLLAKYPILKNNGDITDKWNKGYAVGLDEMNIITLYSELMKDPTIKKISRKSEEEITSGGRNLEKALKEVHFSGKLIPRWVDDIGLIIDSLKISDNLEATGSIERKNGSASIELTASSTSPSIIGSGTTRNKAIASLATDGKHTSGKIELLENEAMKFSAKVDVDSRIAPDGIDTEGTLTLNGDLLGTGDVQTGNELHLEFVQSLKKIPTFDVTVPEGARSIESIMESFGLGAWTPSEKETGSNPDDSFEKDIEADPYPTDGTR